MSYFAKNRCMAVGTQTGRVAICDLKHFKCHMSMYVHIRGLG